MRDNDVVEEAGDGLARVRRGSIEALVLSLTERRVGRKRRCRVRVVCVSLCVVVCLDVEASQKALFLGAAENEKSLTKKAPSARQLSGEGGW